MLIYMLKVFIMRFASNLQDLREDRDISRKELAAALSISVSTLGMYEQGRREPSIGMLVKIADYFNVSIDSLIGRNYERVADESLAMEAIHLKNKIDKLSKEYKDLIEYMIDK